MKFGKLMTCVVATLTLVACNKNNQASGGGNATANETVQITMANPPPGVPGPMWSTQRPPAS